MTASAIMIHGLVWQKMPAFSLYSRRIGGDLAQLEVVPGVGGLLQDDAVFGEQPPADALQGQAGPAVGQHHPGHHAHSLRLEKIWPSLHSADPRGEQDTRPVEGAPGMTSGAMARSIELTI